VGFSGRGSKPPSHQLEGLGSAVSSPRGVWGGALAEVYFYAIFGLQMVKGGNKKWW